MIVGDTGTQFVVLAGLLTGVILAALRPMGYVTKSNGGLIAIGIGIVIGISLALTDEFIDIGWIDGVLLGILGGGLAAGTYHEVYNRVFKNKDNHAE